MVHRNMETVFVLTLLFSIFLAGMSFAVTYTVAIDGSGDYTCDGTNDHIEINQALDAAYADSASGGIVYLKGPATYTIDTTLWVGTNTTLIGDSTVVVRLVDHAGWAQYIPVIKNRRAGTRNISIHGFEINGNVIANADTDYARTGTPLRARNGYYYRLCAFDSGTTNVQVYDMNLHSNLSDVFYINNCDSVFIHDNVIDSTGYDGISFYKGIRAWISGNTVKNSYNNAIKISNVDTAKVCNNTVWGTTGGGTAGILFAKASASAPYNVMRSIEAYGNTVHDTKGPGILLTSALLATTDSAHIHHNTIYRCGAVAVYSGVSTYGFQLRFENNVVDSCRYGGFAIYTGNDGAVSGYVVRLRNNIFSRSVSATAVVARRTGTEVLYLENNCLFHNLLAYNDSVATATDNITSDPLFADTTTYDYHLKSTGGRWNGTAWGTDTEHSPCIDAGYPGSDYSLEPGDNGDCINIGRYGNTTEASKSAVLLSVDSATPKVFSLSQNAPNPFNPSTTIAYTLPATSVVKMVIYNVAGQKVATLVNEKQAAGVHTVQWKPEHLASGVFFCRLEAGNLTKTMRLVYMK